MEYPDCLSTYECSSPIKPEESAVYTPLVELSIFGNKVLLTGNQSSPDVGNHAAITSFQYGTSSGTGGCGVKVEITDEGGLLYKEIVQGLNKDITKVLSMTTGAMGFTAEFGWMITTCDGVSRRETNMSFACEQGGGPVHLLPMNIETIFQDGVVKFILEANDLFVRSFDARLEENLGDERNKMPLKDALRETFTQKDPKFASVEFKNKDGGEDFEFKNSDGADGKGPKAVHTVDQESNVACARKWLNNTRTTNDLGVLIVYNPCTAGIVFQEDPNTDECCVGNIGTYIVNGGNESPVLSFNPSVKWPLGANAGDGGAAAGSSSGVYNKKAEEEDGVQNTGAQSSPTEEQNERNYRTPDEITEKKIDNFTANSAATKPYEMVSPITAELKIIGNPKMVSPIFLTGKWVSIIVIDPYYITEGGGGCEWLSQPTCNPILSNKRWMILGADHQITSGSYVTTLKLTLPTPNVNIPGGTEFGGAGCGTEIPTDSEPNPPQK